MKVDTKGLTLDTPNDAYITGKYTSLTNKSRGNVMAENTDHMDYFVASDGVYNFDSDKYINILGRFYGSDNFTVQNLKSDLKIGNIQNIFGTSNFTLKSARDIIGNGKDVINAGSLKFIGRNVKGLTVSNNQFIDTNDVTGKLEITASPNYYDLYVNTDAPIESLTARSVYLRTNNEANADIDKLHVTSQGEILTPTTQNVILMKQDYYTSVYDKLVNIKAKGTLRLGGNNLRLGEVDVGGNFTADAFNGNLTVAGDDISAKSINLKVKNTITLKHEQDARQSASSDNKY